MVPSQYTAKGNMIGYSKEGRWQAQIISNGVCLSPLPANPLSVLLILLVMFCDIGGERVIRIWRAKQGLYRQ